MESSSSYEPDFAGSGAPQRAAKNLPCFPNSKNLALNEKNMELLKALLPTLQKHKCLETSSIGVKFRRNPWVRAFCDLFHPAGPWSSNKFRRAPSIDSRGARYSFKNNRVKKVLEALKTYRGNSIVHKELLEKLSEFFEKEQYYNDYMEGSKNIVDKEIWKPKNERAPIPTISQDLNAEPSHVDSSDNNIEAETTAAPQHELTCTGIAVLKSNMDCPICNNSYSHDTSEIELRTPIVGKCGHCMCRSCVQNIHLSAVDGEGSSGENEVQCPECRKLSFSADDMTPNFAVCAMLASLAVVQDGRDREGSTALPNSVVSEAWALRAATEATRLEAELKAVKENASKSILDEAAARLEAERTAAQETARRATAEKQASKEAAARTLAEKKAAEDSSRFEEEKRSAAAKAADLEKKLELIQSAARKEKDRLVEAARMAANHTSQLKAKLKAMEENAEKRVSDQNAARLEAERKAAKEAAGRAKAEKLASEESIARAAAEKKAAEDIKRLQSEKKAAEESARSAAGVQHEESPKIQSRPNNEEDYTSPPKRQRLMGQDEEKENHCPSVTPKSEVAENESLQNKNRAKRMRLMQLLEDRQALNDDGNDSNCLCQKIKEKINHLDNEMMMLILA